MVETNNPYLVCEKLYMKTTRIKEIEKKIDEKKKVEFYEKINKSQETLEWFFYLKLLV